MPRHCQARHNTGEDEWKVVKKILNFFFDNYYAPDYDKRKERRPGRGMYYFIYIYTASII